MDEKQNQKSAWTDLGIKLALALAILFPLYVLFYLTFPASLVALYLTTAVLAALFAPWDELKKKFISQ